MAFGIDYSKAFSIVPEGEYEFVITAARVSVTRGGTEFIDIQLTIRNDVDQQCRNRVVYSPIWRRKDPKEEDKACDGFMASAINQLSRAAGLENGKTYAGVAQWCEDLVGKPVRGCIYHEDYNGRTSAKVNRLSPTKFAQVMHMGVQQAAAPVAQNGDEDCPF